MLSYSQRPYSSDPDIDEKSIQFAKKNVQENGLQNRIKLLQTKPDEPLLPLDNMGIERYVLFVSRVILSDISQASTSACATHHSILPPQKCSPQRHSSNGPHSQPALVPRMRWSLPAVKCLSSCV